MSAPEHQQLILKPWLVLACLALGMAIGVVQPGLGAKLGLVGDTFVGLLQMVVLPFMVSAVIFSLQRLFHDGGNKRVLGRVVLVFAAFSVLAAVIGVLTLSVIQPGAHLSEAELVSLGRIIGNDLSSTDAAMNLHGDNAVQQSAQTVQAVALSLIPSNIFAALAQGDTLKALVFSLLFGIALGHVPNRIALGLTQTLDTVYQTCQTMMRWLSYPLPVVLVCMSASQIAKSGVEPFQAMVNFLVAVAAASALCMTLAVLVIWQRSDSSLRQTLHALREPFALAIATRSGMACMPAMMNTLAERLRFSKTRVELLVPLSVSLLQVGPILFFACATLFIAQLYGRPLAGLEWGLLLLGSILAGLASTGMSGLLTLSMISVACSYLELPFEAAFILFIAVDPLCDMLRALVLVIGNTAAVAVICPRPLKI